MPPLSLSVLKTGLIKKGLTRSLDVRRKFCAQKVVRHRHGGAGWGRWEVPCPWQGVGAGVGVVLGPQPDPFCGSHTPQVGLATYSYRSLPWLLLNHSSDLPAVLEQIRTMRYEEPSGNAIGEGNGLGLTRETRGTFLTPPPPFFFVVFFSPRGSHHLRQDLPAEPRRRAPARRAGGAGGPCRRPLGGRCHRRGQGHQGCG